MRAGLVIAITVLCAGGCSEDPWVAANFGASNLRWVPERSLQVRTEGDWVAATLRPDYASYFVSEPFSLLLYEGDRPQGGHTDRDWLTRSVYVRGVVELDRVLEFAPLVARHRTDSSGVSSLTVLENGRILAGLERRSTSGWALGDTTVYVAGDSGVWIRQRR